MPRWRIPCDDISPGMIFPAGGVRLGLVTWGLLLVLLAHTGWADEVILRDGRRLEGSLTQLTSMVEGGKRTTSSIGVEVQPILVIDDDLRRTFVPKRHVTELLNPPPEPLERFNFKQPILRSTSRVASVGPLVSVEPFDPFGRRTVSMLGSPENLTIIQGITVLTPRWAQLDAVSMKGRGFMWEQRIATSGIPLDELNAIFDQLIERAPAGERSQVQLSVVRFFLQAEMVRQAEERLQALVREHPQQAAGFQPMLLRLRQMVAQRILNEVRTRREAGQHRLAMSMLEHFPNENVAGEVLQNVSQNLADYRVQFERGTRLLARIDELLEQLPTKKYLPALKALREELGQELSFNTLNRLSAFEQFHDDDTLSIDDRLALAASGWLIGTSDAQRNLPLAVSLYEVRNLVRQYLSEPLRAARDQILTQIKSQEGGALPLVAKLVGHLKPPLDPGDPVADIPGLYQLDVVVGPGLPAARYYVQLPPEYDPHHIYPAILTLHGPGGTPAEQIEWWAGPAQPNTARLGQATRHGYIVIAPAWTKEHQSSYASTAQEHAIVLNALRDACRRFSIDSNRIYLSGHSMGGDAAWDLAASHPDLWAGVIPIAAVGGDKYVLFYSENSQYVPFYLVGGELDGDKAARNAVHLDRYFTRGYNTTVVEYRGRGHESFTDEIHRLFDWMSRQRREFFPTKFTCRTFRPIDNFFWWLEVRGMPPRTQNDPERWPPAPGISPAVTKAEVTANNGVNVTSGAAEVTVWIAPGVLDFDRPMSINVNGRRLRTPGPYLQPDLAVLLEDVRTRGDRRHPFWAKIEMPAGKVNVASR